MRRFSTLLISAGMLAIPAFSQNQINLTGTWAATYAMGGPAVRLRIDLVQNGNRIDGREQMLFKDSAVVLHVAGAITRNQTGYIRETGVEQVRNFKNVCLQTGQLSIGGPNYFDLTWQTSQCSFGNHPTIRLFRVQQPSVSQNRQPQITAGDALLGMLFLGMLAGGSDSGPSAEQQERNNLYRDQVEAQERIDDDRQRQRDHDEADARSRQSNE